MKGLSALQKAVRRFDRFLISTHVNPDPDALSSQLAMGMFLRQLGKSVDMINEEPLPQRFGFIPYARYLRSMGSGRGTPPQAAIIVDCGAIGRIGKVQERLSPDTYIINIDHHQTNKQFGNLNIVDPDASSTAEIVFGILEALRFKLTPPLARLLYLGIMSDTGSFRYENTSAETHRIVAGLMRFGIPVEEYYRKLYEGVRLDDVQQLTRLLNRFEVHCRNRVVVVSLPRRVQEQFSDGFDLKEKIFQYLRAVRGVEVVAILTEIKPRVTRLNLRSNGAVNVARLAQRFDGGGHAKASGGMVEAGIPGAKKALLTQLRKVLS